jgi:GxxExxY protein
MTGMRIGLLLFGMPRDSTRSAADDVRDDELSHRVIGCAIKVHRVLGNALLESAYEPCLVYELGKAGMTVQRQVLLPLIYEEVRIEMAYRLDLIVNNELVIELKTVSQLLPVHDAQMLTYLRLSGIERGLLMNFHAHSLAKGIKRFVLTRSSA